MFEEQKEGQCVWAVAKGRERQKPDHVGPHKDLFFLTAFKKNCKIYKT